MTLPTEPIGSIPRPAALLEGMQAAAAGQIAADKFEALFDDAVRDTIRRFERPALLSSPTANSESRALRPTRSMASRTWRPAA